MRHAAVIVAIVSLASVSVIRLHGANGAAEPEPATQVAATPSVPPAQIRISTRTAANRTWFQSGTLVATAGNPSAPPGTKLEVIGANGVTLRELIGFAYMNERGSLTRTQIVGAPEWADAQRFDVVVPVPPGAGAGLTYNADLHALRPSPS